MKGGGSNIICSEDDGLMLVEPDCDEPVIKLLPETVSVHVKSFAVPCNTVFCKAFDSFRFVTVVSFLCLVVGEH